MTRVAFALLVLPAFVACSSSSSIANGPDATSTPKSDDVDASTESPDASSSGDDAGVDASSGSDGSAPSDPGSTKGTGGIACASQEDAGGGRKVCVVTLGGTEVKFVEPSGGSGTLKIGAYLHGDGAAAHKSNSAIKALLPWADKHHVLVVSVLSPNRCAWWQDPTQTDCSASATPVPDTEGKNADTFKSVLDALRGAYDVSLGNAYYYGSSGGSIFLTASFVRRFGDGYPGIYALNCGGEKPKKSFSWDTSDVGKRAGTKLFFTYGDKDELKKDIEVAIPFFSGLGFPTDTKIVVDAGHCEFDGHGRAAEIFEANVSP